MKRISLSYPCERCGKIIKPKTTNTKYCKECKEYLYKKYARESYWKKKDKL